MLKLFSSSTTGHFHIYLFQPNLPSFFACSSIPVLTDWQAEKGKSKFIIRKEWDFFLTLGTWKLINNNVMITSIRNKTEWSNWAKFRARSPLNCATRSAVNN